MFSASSILLFVSLLIIQAIINFTFESSKRMAIKLFPKPGSLQ